MSFHFPETLRSAHPTVANFFALTVGSHNLRIIASADAEWERVSVSLQNRVPSWEEMCRVKALFWDDEDVVMQLHARRSQWVNNHVNCLHLWRCIIPGKAIPEPDSILVGVPGGKLLGYK